MHSGNLCVGEVHFWVLGHELFEHVLLGKLVAGGLAHCLLPLVKLRARAGHVRVCDNQSTSGQDKHTIIFSTV